MIKALRARPSHQRITLAVALMVAVLLVFLTGFALRP
jgi:preprotein translocase subunit SecE